MILQIIKKLKTVETATKDQEEEGVIGVRI